MNRRSSFSARTAPCGRQEVAPERMWHTIPRVWFVGMTPSEWYATAAPARRHASAKRMQSGNAPMSLRVTLIQGGEIGYDSGDLTFASRSGTVSSARPTAAEAQAPPPSGARAAPGQRPTRPCRRRARQPRAQPRAGAAIRGCECGRRHRADKARRATAPAASLR